MLRPCVFLLIYYFENSLSSFSSFSLFCNIVFLIYKQTDIYHEETSVNPLVRCRCTKRVSCTRSNIIKLNTIFEYMFLFIQYSLLCFLLYVKVGPESFLRGPLINASTDNGYANFFALETIN